MWASALAIFLILNIKIIHIALTYLYNFYIINRIITRNLNYCFFFIPSLNTTSSDMFYCSKLQIINKKNYFNINKNINLISFFLYNFSFNFWYNQYLKIFNFLINILKLINSFGIEGYLINFWFKFKISFCGS